MKAQRWHRACGRHGASWTTLLQIPTWPKAFPCRGISCSNSGLSFMPGESTAYVSCPQCAKQHLRYFSRLSTRSQKPWRSVFPLPLVPPPKPTQLESLNWESCPDIFCKSYMLLDSNHFLVLLRHSGEHSIFVMTSQSIKKMYFLPMDKAIWKSSHAPDSHIQLALLCD